MRDLYRHLKSTHPECPFTEEGKQKLFAQIFEGEPYKVKKMNNLLSSLSSILQDFVLLQYMKRGTIERRKGLFEAYSKRKLNRYSLQQLRYLQKDFEQQPDATAFRYYEQFKLYYELYFHPETKRVQWGEGLDYVYFGEAWENLNLFYAHMRLRHICEMNFRSKTFVKGFELTEQEYENIHQLVDKHDAPLLEIYSLLYSIQQQPDKQLYKRLKICIFDYINNYNPLETTFLLTFLINYQSKRLGQGYTDAIPEGFSVYERGLQKEIFTNETSYFNIFHFVNIAVYACELEKAVWLEDFIRTWQDYLKEDTKEDILGLANAFLNFAQGKYDDTILLASQVRDRTPVLALTCWTLEIRAHYLKKSKDVYWTNAVNNFQAYLRRNDNIVERRKNANRSFITFIKLLYRATHTKSHSKTQLHNKLATYERIVCKYWLEKQIDKLKK